MAVSTRPFRNIGLSKAAQTHRLRKLRTPSKCRECDSYVYFQGAECEEVSSSSCLNVHSPSLNVFKDRNVRLLKHLAHDWTRSIRSTPSSSVLSVSWHATSAVWRLWPSNVATRSCRVVCSCSAEISLSQPAVPVTASPSSSPSVSLR